MLERFKRVLLDESGATRRTGFLAHLALGNFRDGRHDGGDGERACQSRLDKQGDWEDLEDRGPS